MDTEFLISQGPPVPHTPGKLGHLVSLAAIHYRRDGIYSSNPAKLDGLTNIPGLSWKPQKGHALNVQNMFQNYGQNQKRFILTKHKMNSPQVQCDQPAI